MSKIPSSPFQMETSTRSLRGLFFFVVTEEFVSSFLIFSLIFFIIVDIGPMYHSFDERIWFTFIFSLSKRVTLVPIFFFFFFLPFIMSQLLLSRTELTKCTPSILMENCDHTICRGLTILFLHARAHKV